MRGSYTASRQDADVLNATVGCPGPTSFCRLDGPGLEVTGQRLKPDEAVLACQVISSDPGDQARAVAADR
jgi:hypothetical protein